MDSDRNIHPIILKYAFAAGSRGDALRDPDTRSAIDRLIALGATSPDTARALQDLTPSERSALAWLRGRGLAREVAPDLWYLHQWGWDNHFELTVRQQARIGILVGAVTAVAIWLQYFFQ